MQDTGDPHVNHVPNQFEAALSQAKVNSWKGELTDHCRLLRTICIDARLQVTTIRPTPGVLSPRTLMTSRKLRSAMCLPILFQRPQTRVLHLLAVLAQSLWISNCFCKPQHLTTPELPQTSQALSSRALRGSEPLRPTMPVRRLSLDH